MKPSRFRGVLSQGMLLAASQDDKVVELLEPAPGTPLGERVQLETTEPLKTPDPVLKPKQRVFETVANFLRTNDDRIATYKGIRLVTSAGPVTCKSITQGTIS